MKTFWTILLIVIAAVSSAQNIKYEKVLSPELGGVGSNFLSTDWTNYVSFAYIPIVGLSSGGIARINQVGTIAGSSLYTDSINHCVVGAILMSSANKLILSGYSYSNYSFIFQTDTLGNIEWQLAFHHGNNRIDVQEIKETSSGDFLAVCNIDSANKYIGYIIRISKEGVCKWIKKVDPVTDQLNSVEEIDPNRFMLFGQSNLSGDDYVWTLGLTTMIDSLGNILWTKNYGGFTFSHTSFRDSWLLNSNEIFLTGESDEFGMGKRDVFIAKMDSSGTIKFLNLTGDAFDQHAYAITFINPDKLIVAGSSFYNSTQSYGLMIMADTAGNILRSRLYSGGYAMGLGSVSIKGSQNSMLACGFRTYSLGGDPLLYLLSSNGFGYSHCSKKTAKFKNQRIDSVWQSSHSESMTSVISDTIVHTIYVVPKTSAFYASCSYTTCTVNANFSADKYRNCVNDSILLHNYSMNAATYTWYLDGAFVSDLAEPVIGFSLAGKHELMLVAQDGSCYDTASVTMTIDNFPNADFSFTKNHQQVLFANADTANLYYHWDFGDGSKSWLADPMHHFLTREPYMVCLATANSCGMDTQCLNVDLSDTNYITFQRGHLLGGLYHIPKGLIQTFDGGYLFMGLYNNVNDGQTSLMKFDRHGDYEWGKMSGGSSVLSGAALVRSKDEGFFLFEFGNGSHVTKYDDSGMEQWGMSLAGYYFNNVYEFEDGSYLFFGTYQDSLSLIKTDHFARRLWQKKYGNVGFLSGSVHTNDGFAMLGRNFNNNQPVLVKIDESGNILWEKEYSGFPDLLPHQMTKTSDGGFLIAANYEAGSNYYPLLVFKTDSNGNILWTQWLSRVGEKETCIGMFEQIQSTDFYVVLLGEVLKFDSSGTLLWNNHYWVGTDHQFHRAYASFDGGLILGGYYYIGVIYNSILTKLSKDGESGCFKTHTDFTIANVSLNQTDVNYSSQSHLENLTGSGPFFGSMSFNDEILCYFNTQCPVVANFDDTTLLNEAQFFDSSLNVLEWHWDFGDGDSSLEQNPIHLYDSGGVYNVCLIAKGDCENDTLCKQVTISCLTVADFSYTITGNDVQFADSSALETSWYWDFGDGTNSSDENPDHVYPGPGEYHVCLTSFGPCNSDSLCQDITILATGFPTVIISDPCHIYPNPVSDVITIDCSGLKETNPGIVIIDLSGHKLFEAENIAQAKDFNLNKLSSGVYAVKVLDKDNQVISIQKFVKID